MNLIKLSPKQNSIFLILFMISFFQISSVQAQKKGTKEATDFNIKIDSNQQVSLVFKLKKSEYIRIYVYTEDNDLVYACGHFGVKGLNTKKINAQYHYKGKYKVVIKNEVLELEESFIIN